MRIIKVRTLRDYWEKHPVAGQPLKSWIVVAKGGDWKSPADVKQFFRSVDLVGENRAIFNIGGNNYRLFVHCRFDIGCLFVRFIGDHATYDRINARTI